ncbi:MAG: diacylglycerol kinase [Gammaproteobacteria bacterium]|nr:diacylglycerol kinase [Gammaproteobacteria bacterium]
MFKPENNTGLKRIINAAKFSYQGFVATFKTEAAFRQECFAGIIALPLSFFVASTAIEWILLVGSFLLVMLVEIINSAIEATVDRFGEERHELSGKAKDAGSAAVFMALTICTLTWLVIFIA